MEKKLTWFDKLMIAVSFAEAGVETPDLSGSTSGTNQPKDIWREERKILAAGRSPEILVSHS